MKTTLEIVAMGIVYTIASVLFGMFVAYHFFNKVLPVIQTQVWRQGCNECIQFEKNQQERDQLQGVRSAPDKIQ